MEYVPLYLKAVLALFIIFVLPGLLVVRVLKIDDLPQRWLAVFLSSITVNYLAVTIMALIGAKPTVFYGGMVLCFIVALIVLEVRRPKFSSTASEVRSSDVIWLLFSLIVLAATYSDIRQFGIPSTFNDGDVSFSWNTWAIQWASGVFPSTWGYPQFVPTIWAAAYLVTGSHVQYFAFYCYLILIVAPLALTAMVLGRQRWWLPLVMFSVFVCVMTGRTDAVLRSTLAGAYPDWVAVIFSFAGAAAFLSQRPPHQRSFAILLLALFLECVAAATKPAFGLFVIAFALAICIDANRHADDPTLRKRVIVAVVCIVSLFAMAYALHLTLIVKHGLSGIPLGRPPQAWEKFNSAFSLPVRILCLSGLLLSLLLPRARWLAVPLFLGIWFWVERTSYDLRNAMGLILIAALIPVDALAHRYIKSDAGAFGRRWTLKDTTVAACALVALLLVTLPMAKADKELETKFEADQFRFGPGTAHNEAIARNLRAGCKLFSITRYPLTIVSLQSYKSQIHFFYSELPIGDDSSFNDRIRKHAVDLQREFENVQGCAAVIFGPKLQQATGLRFLQDYFQRHNLRKEVDANGFELWSSNQAGR